MKGETIMAYNEGMSPADYAAINNGGGFGNGNDWWILLFLLWGGWGGNGGWGGGHGGAPATQADLSAGFANSEIMSDLNDLQLGQAGIQQTLCQGFNGVNTTVLQGFNALQAQNAECCCTTQRAIDAVNYNVERQFCDTRYLAEKNTRDIIENANCNTRAILDAMNQYKMDALRDENQTLRLQASQTAQNAYLINQLRPAPVPAYAVANPYCCTPACGNGFGNGYGYAAG
jgi:hypothetical protein